jgi:hypothetical protein
MKRMLTLALAGAVTAASMIVPVAPAAAGGPNFQFGFGFADDDDDWRWRRHRHRDRHWGHYNHRPRHYGHYYRHRHWDDDDDFGRNAAAATFGFIAGAATSAIAGATAGGSSYERCEARFKTFDPDTWTYMGYDGYRHRCPY